MRGGNIGDCLATASGSLLFDPRYASFAGN
jgi:hypothetical protein